MRETNHTEERRQCHRRRERRERQVRGRASTADERRFTQISSERWDRELKGKNPHLHDKRLRVPKDPLSQSPVQKVFSGVEGKEIHFLFASIRVYSRFFSLICVNLRPSAVEVLAHLTKLGA